MFCYQTFDILSNKSGKKLINSKQNDIKGLTENMIFFYSCEVNDIDESIKSIYELKWGKKKDES